MHYQRTFLTKVILRFDFAEIPALRGDMRPDFSGRIEDIYPVVASQPIASVTMTLGPENSSVQQQNVGRLWQHRKTTEGTKLVSLAPTFLSVEYGTNDYDHFPTFRGEIERVFAEFNNIYHIAEMSRVGLRYINEISFPQGNALDWNNLLRPDLIASAKCGLLDGMQMVRSVHQLQTTAEGHTILLHYGFFNPDYPNPLVRRHFVLDYDAFRSEATPSADVLARVNQMNELCERMFEWSIEQGLREQMGIIND